MIAAPGEIPVIYLSLLISILSFTSQIDLHTMITLCLYCMYEQLFCEGCMGNKDGDYDILYRGETRDYIPPGRVMFIQRPKECGGGYWLGKAYDNAFIFEIERPVSLSEGIDYIMILRSVERHADEFDDNFTLF